MLVYMCMCVCRLLSPLDRYLGVRGEMETMRQRDREEEERRLIKEGRGNRRM